MKYFKLESMKYFPSILFFSIYGLSLFPFYLFSPLQICPLFCEYTFVYKKYTISIDYYNKFKFIILKIYRFNVKNVKHKIVKA